MCEKKSYYNPEIDTCIQKFVERIKRLTPFKTLCSCCGHGKYPTTVVIKDKQGNVFELFSRLPLGEKKRNSYYQSDKNGFYFIPKVERLRKASNFINKRIKSLEERLERNPESKRFQGKLAAYNEIMIILPEMI